MCACAEWRSPRLCSALARLGSGAFPPCRPEVAGQGLGLAIGGKKAAASVPGRLRGLFCRASAGLVAPLPGGAALPWGGYVRGARGRGSAARRQARHSMRAGGVWRSSGGQEPKEKPPRSGRPCRRGLVAQKRAGGTHGLPLPLCDCTSEMGEAAPSKSGARC